jgi:hypothetical protein
MNLPHSADNHSLYAVQQTLVHQRTGDTGDTETDGEAKIIPDPAAGFAGADVNLLGFRIDEQIVKIRSLPVGEGSQKQL